MDADTKKPPAPEFGAGGVRSQARQRAIFPVKSIVAAEGLNHRVRNGNWCVPLAMATAQKNRLSMRWSSGSASHLQCTETGAPDRRTRPHQGTPQRHVMDHTSVMTKPMVRLVPVSSGPFDIRPYTPGLSTWWSSRGLMGTIHLEGGFTLRCFQRLSLPHVATQHCTERHNWYTRGVSNPILSY